MPPQLDERQEAIRQRITAGPRGRIRGPLALWLYSPDLAERAQHLGEFLRFGSGFEPRLSELIILCVAAHHQCRFEWFVHAPIAARAGVPEATIAALEQGTEPAFEAPDEMLVHAFCTALLRRNSVDGQTFEAFLARFGERGVVEATAIMGYYQIGAHLLNAVEYNAPADVQPFAQR
jgi:4-carboxymuconolactone decarboxylase